MSSKYKGPVVCLRLALSFWARQCAENLRSVVFEPVPNWELTLTRSDLQTVLSVYVDDFKMAAPNGLVHVPQRCLDGQADAPWEVFGRGHEKVDVVPPEVIRASTGHVSLLFSQPRPTNPRAGGDPCWEHGGLEETPWAKTDNDVNGNSPSIKYDMYCVMEQCVWGATSSWQIYRS